MPQAWALLARAGDKREGADSVRKPVSTSTGLPTIPGYEVLSVQGEGGCGVVYKARELAQNRLVALELVPAKSAQFHLNQRLPAEIEAAARLAHPNILPVYNVGVYEGRPFMAMELVEGGTLARLLFQRRMLPARDAARMIAALARAVHYAHECGVVHGDLKPAHICLPDSGLRSSVVTAVGAAQVANGVTVPASAQSTANHSKTRVNPVKPPEGEALTPKITGFGVSMLLESDVARETGGLTADTDIRALGVILYQCLTGRHPFNSESSRKMSTVAPTAPIPPSRLQPHLPPDLDTICLKALADDPARRYRSAAVLASDLERFLAGATVTEKSGGAAGLLRMFQRRPVHFLTGVFLLGIIAAGIGLWFVVTARAGHDRDEGRRLEQAGAYTDAAARYQRGMERLKNMPFSGKLQKDVQKGFVATTLRDLNEQMRLLPDAPPLEESRLRQCVERSQNIWSMRALILAYGYTDPTFDARVRGDLLDCALLSMALSSALATDKEAADSEALTRLNEIDELLGKSPAAVYERKALLLRTQRRAAADRLTVPEPQTALEHDQLGRAHWRDGKLNYAALMFEAGLRIDPDAIFVLLDRGECARQRERYSDAIEAYSSCITLKPEPSARILAVVHARRARSLEARAAQSTPPSADDLRRALADFDRALVLAPDLAEAYYGRGMLHLRAKNFPGAIADLKEAIRHGCHVAFGYYSVALAQYEAGEPDNALASVQDALKEQADFPEAQKLKEQIEKQPFKTPR